MVATPNHGRSSRQPSTRIPSLSALLLGYYVYERAFYRADIAGVVRRARARGRRSHTRSVYLRDFAVRPRFEVSSQRFCNPTDTTKYESIPYLN